MAERSLLSFDEGFHSGYARGHDDGAAEMAIALMFAEWVERHATRQRILANLCGLGIHSYGHGDACVECGAPE